MTKYQWQQQNSVGEAIALYQRLVQQSAPASQITRAMEAMYAAMEPLLVRAAIRDLQQRSLGNADCSSVVLNCFSAIVLTVILDVNPLRSDIEHYIEAAIERYLRGETI